MSAPWLFRMRWLDLLFAHWPVDPSALAAILPPGLELDTYDGEAWLGIVPFTMADVAPRGVPAIPGVSTFPEINVRTYVRRHDRPGVLFLSLDAASRLTVEGGRRVFNLPYFRAGMASARTGDTVTYLSRRTDRRGPPATFSACYRATGPAALAESGSLADWLTRRLRRPAEAEIDENTMAAAHGLRLPDLAPHLMAVDRLDVRGWRPVIG